MKNIHLFFLLLFQIVVAQQKISVLPFSTDPGQKAEWLSYGLSYMLTEALTATAANPITGQDEVFALIQESNRKIDLDIVITGQFEIDGENLVIVAEIRKTPNPSIRGKFGTYTEFYLTAIRLAESVYQKLNELGVKIDDEAKARGNSTIRSLVSDYESYQSYIKNWLALKYYETGVAEAEAKNWEKAAVNFKTAERWDEGKLLNVTSNLVAISLKHGNELYEKSDWAGAEASFQEALIADGSNSEVLFNLGNVSRANGSNDAAIEYYKKATAVNPDHFESAMNLGNLYSMLGKTADAISVYENAKRIRPDNAYANYYIGITHDENGNRDVAMDYYKQALALDSTIAGAHINLGIIYKQKKDLKNARSEFETALRHDSQNAQAHRSLGILLITQHTKKAIFHLEKTLEIDPGQDGATTIQKNIKILKKRLSKNKDQEGA